MSEIVRCFLKRQLRQLLGEVVQCGTSENSCRFIVVFHLEATTLIFWKRKLKLLRFDEYLKFEFRLRMLETWNSCRKQQSTAMFPQAKRMNYWTSLLLLPPLPIVKLRSFWSFGLERLCFRRTISS